MVLENFVQLVKMGQMRKLAPHVPKVNLSLGISEIVKHVQMGEHLPMKKRPASHAQEVNMSSEESVKIVQKDITWNPLI